MDKFKLYGDWIVLHEHHEYSRTTSGKSWKRKADAVKRDILTADEYSNFVNSVAFFNKWGDGASCRASKSYTVAGYLPNRIVTVSPYKMTRCYDWFWFVSPRDLFRNAGTRERGIVERAETWVEEFPVRGGITYTFYTPTNENGQRDGATYTTINDAWI